MNKISEICFLWMAIIFTIACIIAGVIACLYWANWWWIASYFTGVGFGLIFTIKQIINLVWIYNYACIDCRYRTQSKIKEK